MLMYNLHLVVTSSTGPIEACEKIDKYLLDYGNENNWYHVCGCVSEHGDSYVHDKSVGQLDVTIEEINEMVSRWLQPCHQYKQAFEAVNTAEKLSNHLWYYAMKYCEHQYRLWQVGLKKDSEFNILENSFNSCKFTENGVTRYIDAELHTGEILYIVFVDMHS